MKPDARERRRQLYELLGDLPPRERPIAAHTIGEESRGGYVLEKLLLDLNGVEAVPAYFVRPSEAPPAKRLPTILYNHAHGGDYVLGKDELIRARGAIQSPYADELTRH